MKLVSFVSVLFHQVGSIGYESLKVQNHTECECIYRNRQIATHSRHAGTSRVSHALPRTTSRRPARSSRCRCPSHFDAEVDEGHCGCVCRDGKAECRRRYEGKEGFTLSDQRFVFDFIQSPTYYSTLFTDASCTRYASSHIACTARISRTTDDVPTKTTRFERNSNIGRNETRREVASTGTRVNNLNSRFA